MNPKIFALTAVTLATPILSLPSLGAETNATSLLNGRNLDGIRQPVGEWLTAEGVLLHKEDNRRFSLKAGEGILVNGEKGRTRNLITEHEHGDVEAHIEFVVPKGSNSGVYFMGRYEIQAFDSWGKPEVKYADCGGIYQRWMEKEKRGYEGHAPRTNASRPPGEWQTFDVIFRAPRFDARGRKTANARFVKVVHNGVTIHENVEVTGPTRSPAFNDEKAKGPLMFQGDHGPVAYRNVRVKSLTLD